MSDTFAAQLTGSGRGAVATVAISGRHALACVMSRFSPATKSVKALKSDRIYFGTWNWQSYEEELVVCRVADDQIEIHCHGGQLAARTILASLSDAGADVVSPDQWLALLQPDRFVREALALLPRVKTANAAAIVLDQSRHAMRQALTALRGKLNLQDASAVVEQLQRIVAFGAFGTRLADPFRVVLVGAPNTGKSSLVNAIVGFDRAIVYDQPGTTRDIVFAETALNGWPVTFTDTAGFRETNDPVERAGIEIASQQLEKADLVLLIHDLTSDDGNDTPQVPAVVTHEWKKTIRVGTKCDLDPAPMAAVDITTSATLGIGIESLNQQIMHELIPQLPSTGAAVPISRWQLEGLESLLSLLKQHQIDEAQELLSELLLPSATHDS